MNALAQVNLQFEQEQRIDGEVSGDQFGSYEFFINGTNLVGGTYKLGDLNGNGFLDLVVGAGRATVDGASRRGRVYIFFNNGQGSFDGAVLSASNADAFIDSDTPVDRFGASIELADVNGDGFLDIIVGSPGRNVGIATEVGEVFVFFNDGTGQFASTIAGADVTITGQNEGDEFGTVVAAAELNGVGFPDLVVGAPKYNVNAFDDAGRVYVFLNTGAPNFYAAAAANADHTIDAEEVEEFFGTRIVIGDIDNDGNVDLIVGSPFADPNGLTDAGSVYVFLNDGAGGFPTSTAAADARIDGHEAGMVLGSCINVGDLNGNGWPDLIAGAPRFEETLDEQGGLFLFFNTGVSPFFPNSAANADQTILGMQFGELFGTTCRIAPIRTQADLIVSATRFNVLDNGILFENAGAVDIFINDTAGNFPSTAADADLRLVGQGTNHRFGSGIAVADLNNDGLADLVIGARFADFAAVDTGSLFVFLQQEIPPPDIPPGVPLCEKVRVDRVICDEIFYIQDLEEDVPVGQVEVPQGSTVAGTVSVTVLECQPVIDVVANELSALVTLMIQKELAITTPDEEVLPLEFGFRIQRNLPFRKCTPEELAAIDAELLQNLRCHVVQIDATDLVTLDPGDPGEVNATFDEDLTVLLKLKLVQEQQLILARCAPAHQMDIPVAVPVEQL